MTLKVSFEFFPPQTDLMEERLKTNVQKLIGLMPSFVSITYGAGGSTREKTHSVIKKIITQTPLNVAAHLTCVDASKNETKKVINDYLDIGVRHIVALRGDMKDLNAFEPHPEGFRNSIELIEYIKSRANITVSISGYPEPHLESKGYQSDIDFLRAKIDSGADQIITQFCLNTDYYLRYRDQLDKEGITTPIIPGIMLIKKFRGIEKMSKKIGVEVPTEILNIIEKNLTADEEKNAAEEFAIDQCEKLSKNGFENLHFYTLNESEIMIAIANKLGLENHAN
jgi:methylenetetrahydrofolate reductase (NADPH)